MQHCILVCAEILLAKTQISDPAREKLNAKLSKEKLMFILASNFRKADLVVGLDYRDERLPKTREEADKVIAALKFTNNMEDLKDLHYM